MLRTKALSSARKVGTYKRVGGTPLGGGTFLALGCLLTGAKSHKELLELAEVPAATSAYALNLLVYAALIYGCQEPQGAARTG